MTWRGHWKNHPVPRNKNCMKIFGTESERFSTKIYNMLHLCFMFSLDISLLSTLFKLKGIFHLSFGNLYVRLQSVISKFISLFHTQSFKRKPYCNTKFKLLMERTTSSKITVKAYINHLEVLIIIENSFIQSIQA